MFKAQDLESALKNELKSNDTFLELKDLILSNPNYPIFVYAAEPYNEYFREVFKENYILYSLQNVIACTLANDMIYLDTTDFTKIPDMKNDFYLIDDDMKTYINPQMALKNRYLAVQHYNSQIAAKILNSSKIYYTLYKQELNSLQNAPLEDILHYLKTFKLIIQENTSYVIIYLI